MLKVAKFGGSSVSNGAQFAKVKKIIEADESRSVIVVSAPGKRFQDDNKITDLLYLCNAHIKYDVSYDSIFAMVEERFTEIVETCGLSIDLPAELKAIRDNLKNGVPLDYLASRGEYLNAKLLAEYLGYKFVDAAECIAMNFDGSVDYEATEAQLNDMVNVYGKIVIPGFYGYTPNGKVKVFSRGGSDITGAIAAACLNADVYENWTDVSGILMVDPRIVKDPKPIERVTYAELRELAYMGASVLHEDAVLPVRRCNIPLNIRNTNEPDHPGTIIREEFPSESKEENARFITGITGRKHFKIINVYISQDKSKTSVQRQVLEICERFDISVEQTPSGIDSFSVIISEKELDGKTYDLIAAIKRDCPVDEVTVTGGISIIAIVGRQMAYRAGISGKIFSALGDNEINIRTIEQGSDEINIMVSVFTADFERAIRVLYDSFAL